MATLRAEIRQLKRERTALRKYVKELEHKLEKGFGVAHRVSLLKPKNGDIICISGPDITKDDAVSVEQMLKSAGVSHCFFYTVPSTVSIQTFPIENQVLFDTMLKGPRV